MSGWNQPISLPRWIKSTETKFLQLTKKLVLHAYIALLFSPNVFIISLHKANRLVKKIGGFTDYARNENKSDTIGKYGRVIRTLLHIRK